MQARSRFVATAVLIASVAILGMLTPGSLAADKLSKAHMDKFAAAIKRVPKATIGTHTRENPNTVGDKKVYKGTIQVSHPSRGKTPAEVAYTIEQAMGKGDHTMVVENKT